MATSDSDLVTAEGVKKVAEKTAGDLKTAIGGGYAS